MGKRFLSTNLKRRFRAVSTHCAVWPIHLGERHIGSAQHLCSGSVIDGFSFLILAFDGFLVVFFRRSRRSAFRLLVSRKIPLQQVQPQRVAWEEEEEEEEEGYRPGRCSDQWVGGGGGG